MLRFPGTSIFYMLVAIYLFIYKTRLTTKDFLGFFV